MTHELLTTGQMGEADRLTIAGGTAGYALMESAGAAVARVTARTAARLRPGARRIGVVCGPGNNGGDGLVAARLLRERGFEVEVVLLGRPAALRGDAAEAARRFAGPVGAPGSLDLAACEVIVDALFGAGLARDLDGEARTLVEGVNASGRPVVAVDVPSGLDGNTGMIRGVAVQAAVTVTFFRFKPGHLLMPGRALCGALELAEIGIETAVLAAIAPNAFVNEPALWRHELRPPRTGGQKYDRGHAVVVSGGLTHTGAARLAARGALRAGAGLVTMASPGDALLAHAAHLTAIMLARADGPEALGEILADHRKNAVALGPALGVGAATRALVEAALLAPHRTPDGPPRAVVLDADALTSFSGDADSLANLIGRARGSAVITPHDGEFARLFSSDEELLRTGSKLERTRAAARLLGAVVVLKGPDTVVAAPDGRAAVGRDLPPWLGTAGSGDVLGGIVCGLLATGMPGFEAACAGVWLHGATARLFGPGLIAEDLPEQLPTVYRGLFDPSGPSVA